MEAPAPLDEAGDATRRTRLANERTYLAWWRTGLTTLAVAFGAGKLVPALTSGAAWPFEVVGVCFAVVGAAAIVYGFVRQRAVERALRAGSYAPFDDRAAGVFTTAGLLLAAATVALLFVER